MSEDACRKDLELIITEAAKRDIPVIIGSAGGQLHPAPVLIRSERTASETHSPEFHRALLRVVLAIVLSVPLGTAGIWSAWPLGWVLGMALSVYFYRRV